MTGLAGVPALAAQQTGGRSAEDFYTPPSPLPAGKDGDIIRSEPMHLALSLPGSGKPLPAAATRVMYRSEDTHGTPTATTGTYFDPAIPWHGKGKRPLVSFAVGTIGQGDQCAPSKLFAEGATTQAPGGPIVEYETPVIYSMLARGVAVIVTDYQGLGTPGMHTYVNRAAEAHAVLDAARAAQRLPAGGVSSDAPVLTWGYSQGGGASAAAAELASSYAPELNIRGSYAGAPPADLKATLKQVDGNAIAGVIGYSLNSMMAAYPEIRQTVDENINQQGKDFLAKVADQCIGQTAIDTAGKQTKQFTKTGEPLDVVLNRLPIAQKILAEQQIGNRKPEAPVLIQQGVNDDVVPFGQSKTLAKQWCAKGSTVQFSAEQIPPLAPGTALGHIGPYLVGQPEAQQWLNDRLDGKSAPANCSSL
jgi:alpha-beta hydrolase superfamily lysophospholipase